MSFSINGITWTPQTAAEHAQNELNVLNANLSAASLPTLIPVQTNGIWQELLAAGSLQQDQDTAMVQAFNSFNVSLCDDNQVLNLLPITGTSLLPATYSTVTLNVTASASGSCVVPAGTQAPLNNSINFITDITTTVPAGTTVGIIATCDTPGEVNAGIGVLTSFSGAPLTNFQSVTNPSNAIVGANTETISQLRTRLIAGAGTIGWTLNGAILAIRALQGLNYATIYYNPSNTTELILPGAINVDPRTAYIVVSGSDVTSGIANAYFSRMTAPTMGSNSENYVTLAGQAIPVYFDYATNQAVYVNVYYDPNKPSNAGFQTVIQNIVVGLSGTINIGQEITSTMVLNALANFPYATITGASISLDNITYTRAVSINANRVATFASNHVNVVSGP